jgi:ABC-2 type transport system ATP-binding protein
MISVRNLWKRYGEYWALRGLSFEVGAGSIYGLIGPNGAGKTTVLRILAGVLAPTFGEAQVGGLSVVRDPRAVRPRLGFLPELFQLYDELRVVEYLEFFAGAHGVPERERGRVVADILRLVELEAKRDALLGALSKGMRQRLLLGKCLVHDPAVLILDEPAAGLDPRARIELRSILRMLAQMGKTILISSHILPELSDMCDAIGILEEGRVLASGPVAEIESRLSPARRVKLAFRGGREEVAAVLRGIDAVSSSEVLDGSATLEVEGDEAEKGKVVAALVHAGVTVLDFHEERRDLEEIFLRISKGGPG